MKSPCPFCDELTRYHVILFFQEIGETYTLVNMYVAWFICLPYFSVIAHRFTGRTKPTTAFRKMADNRPK